MEWLVSGITLAHEIFSRTKSQSLWSGGEGARVIIRARRASGGVHSPVLQVTPDEGHIYTMSWTAYNISICVGASQLYLCTSY